MQKFNFWEGNLMAFRDLNESEINSVAGGGEDTVTFQDMNGDGRLNQGDNILYYTSGGVNYSPSEWNSRIVVTGDRGASESGGGSMFGGGWVGSGVGAGVSGGGGSSHGSAGVGVGAGYTLAIVRMLTALRPKVTEPCLSGQVYMAE
jgi:hypothetical protein